MVKCSCFFFVWRQKTYKVILLMFRLPLVFLLFFSFPLFSIEKGSALIGPNDIKTIPSLQKNTNSSSVTLISPHYLVQKNESFLIGIRIKIPKSWHSYWSYAGDFGLAPKIKWESINNVLIEPLLLPTPQRKSFSIGETNFYSFIYETELLIPFKVLIQENYNKNDVNFFFDLEWALCKDICFSKKTKIQLNLKIASTSKINPSTKKVFDMWEPLFPKKLHLKSQFKNQDTTQIIQFSFKETGIKCLDVFPSGSADFSSAPPTLLNQGSQACAFQVKKSQSNLTKISGLLLYSKNGKQDSSLFQSTKQDGLGIFWFILMAFLGGLILNFMPCVLPIIFLKFYNTLELKDLPSTKILFLNLSYTAGIISSFLILAFVIFITKQTGENLGWGFHLQSPIFITFLSLLFTLMAFYLLNVISFSAPRVSLLFKDTKMVSHFLTGVMSTTAASPCTAPFMVSAMGFAFSHSYLEIFIIFFFLGLGLSFPYLVLSVFPQTFKYIPKPGPKTNILKRLLSIPLFLTTIWLLSVLYLQVNFKVFVLTLIAFPFLLLWIILQKIIQKSSLKITINFIFIILAIFFFIGQKKLYSSSQKQVLLPTHSKFTSRDLTWMTFYEEKLLSDRQEGKNIFLAFGAKWCLTCKFNERIFNSDEFVSLVKKNQIQLYYGDWTSPKPEITQFMESYNQQGVPFYIFFKGEEKLFLFPTLLFKDTFLQELKTLSE